MAFEKMTPQRYAALVSAFIRVGGPVFARVGREAGVDRQTAKRGWETGWPEVGPWAKPISTDFEALLHGQPPIANLAQATPAGVANLANADSSANLAQPDPAGPANLAKPTATMATHLDDGDKSAAGARPAPVRPAQNEPPPSVVVPPTYTVPVAEPPTTDLVPATPTTGLTPKQQKARDKEEDAVLGSLNNVLGLNALTNKVLAAFMDKAPEIIKHLGKVGDGKGGYIADPHAAKHMIDGLVQLTNANTKAAETMLKVMEASRLNAGQAQSISETRTPESKTDDIGTIVARVHRMAEVALSMQRGKAIATHYQDAEVVVVDAEVGPAEPPTPTD